MVKISDRLKTVANMCHSGGVVADIGTDHAYLPIYLVSEGIAESAIAMDLRTGPLEKAKKHIRDNNLGDRIQTRLSDGLTCLGCGEADTVTICGMGGRLIAQILTKGKEAITPETQIIVSPQSEVGDFRHFLIDNNYAEINEKMIKDEGKFYFIIECGYQKSVMNKNQYSQAQYEYGWKLLESKDEVLKEYLIKEKDANKSIMNHLINNSDNPVIKNRLSELLVKEKVIDDALSYFD